MEPPNRPHSAVLVGVFVGGRSSRMGFPKGLAQFEGERTIDRVVRAATVLGPTVLVGTDPGYLTGLTLVDDAADVEGPLAGLLALLDAAGGRDVIALSCDAPFLHDRDLSRLSAPLSGTFARLARRGDDAPLEPFFARYAAALAPEARRFVAGGGRSITRLVESLPHEAFVPDDPRVLDDWDDVDAVLRGGGSLPPGVPCAIPRR